MARQLFFFFFHRLAKCRPTPAWDSFESRLSKPRLLLYSSYDVRLNDCFLCSPCGRWNLAPLNLRLQPCWTYPACGRVVYFRHHQVCKRLVAHLTCRCTMHLNTTQPQPRCVDRRPHTWAPRGHPQRHHPTGAVSTGFMGFIAFWLER